VLQCNVLASAGLADRLTYPGQEVYTARVGSYWSLAAQLDPYCIIQPQDASEVSRAVVALVKANKKHECKFAVRSGGHTTVRAFTFYCWIKEYESVVEVMLRNMMQSLYIHRKSPEHRKTDLFCLAVGRRGRHRGWRDDRSRFDELNDLPSRE
jgi:hypothetical protein